MKENLRHYIGYGLAVSLVTITTIAVSACSSPSTTAVSTEVPTATSVAPTQQAQPSTSSGGNFQQRQGTMGTLSSVNGNTLTLTNAQGNPVTVNVSDTTTIQKTVVGTISDLQQGDVLMVARAGCQRQYCCDFYINSSCRTRLANALSRGDFHSERNT